MRPWIFIAALALPIACSAAATRSKSGTSQGGSGGARSEGGGVSLTGDKTYEERHDPSGWSGTSTLPSAIGGGPPQPSATAAPKPAPSAKPSGSAPPKWPGWLEPPKEKAPPQSKDLTF